MGTGDLGRPSLAELVREVPLYRRLHPEAFRHLIGQADSCELPAGAVVLSAGRPVQWVPASVWGGLRAEPGHEQWGPGEVVGLGEALLHGVATSTVVTRGPSLVVFVDVRALTAAAAVDPGFGLALAREVAARAPLPHPRRRRFSPRSSARVSGAAA